MGIDFDALVNAPCIAVFGDKSQTGKSWTYTPASGTAFDIDGIFDEAYARVSGGSGNFAPVSTTAPRFLIQKSDADAHDCTPVQGDTLTGPDGTVWRLEEAEPDGFGALALFLTRTAF